jgi:hypothetical protein
LGNNVKETEAKEGENDGGTLVEFVVWKKE